MWAILKALFGFAPKIWGHFFGKEEKARREERRVVMAEVRAVNAEAKAKGEYLARETEREMHQAQEEIREAKPKKRRPRAGDNLMGMLVWGLALGLVLSFGCATHQPPPAPVVICPKIPVPSRPVLTPIILPESNEDGDFCLTPEQVDDLAAGIDDLKTYADQLEAAIRIYNGTYSGEPAE